MSRIVLLLVVGGLLAGASWLSRSLIAAARPEPASTGPLSPRSPTPVDPPDQPAPEPHRRAWGPEQACGPPDSPAGGDVPTAWAPASADDQNEWLELTYSEPIQPIAVLVFEACGPGALSQIELEQDPQPDELAPGWVTVWGDDPRPVAGNKRIVNAPVAVDFATRRVRLSLLSTMVSGWNEIDAVGLLDAAGKVHWALAARASSSYAGDSGEPRPAR